MRAPLRRPPPWRAPPRRLSIALSHLQPMRHTQVLSYEIYPQDYTLLCPRATEPGVESEAATTRWPTSCRSGWAFLTAHPATRGCRSRRVLAFRRPTRPRRRPSASRQS
eukprot:3863478-Prymnesium_polylepis.1